jgi:Zn-dependent M28 family amino/carboxypeptidase
MMKMKADKDRMYGDVEFLTELFPPRNGENIESLEEAASYIEGEFLKLGCLVENQYFTVDGHEYRNVIASFNPDSKKRLIVGAHYDVCGDTPGADDNGSAVAGLLECARLFDAVKPEIGYRVDFVAYCLEEPPFFRTPDMGSAVHAKSLLPVRNDILGMICLEMIGYFSDEPGSQEIPLKDLRRIFPDTGNFIVVAGRNRQKKFAETVTSLISEKCTVPAFTVTDPRLSSYLELSDHFNYLNYGFDAVMINDTSMLRNKNYHREGDTIEKLDFDRMAEVVNGCYNAVKNMEHHR